MVDYRTAGIEGLMKQMSDERKASATNMRLGAFIDTLAGLDPLMPVALADGKGVHKFMSYRGYYEDLAISPQPDLKSVGEVLQEARNALGEVFEGYKGGDFPMHKNSLLWVAPYGGSGGNMLTGVRLEIDRVVVETALHPDYL